MMLSVAMPTFAQSREEKNTVTFVEACIARVFFTIATSTLVDSNGKYVYLKVDPAISTKGVCVNVLPIQKMCHFRNSNCIIDPRFLSARPQDCEATYSSASKPVWNTYYYKLHFHMQTVAPNMAVLQAWLKLANTVLFYTQTFSSIGANKL